MKAVRWRHAVELGLWGLLGLSGTACSVLDAGNDPPYGCAQASAVVSASSVYHQKFSQVRGTCAVPPVTVDLHRLAPPDTRSDPEKAKGMTPPNRSTGVIPWSLGRKPYRRPAAFSSRAVALAPLVDAAAARHGVDPLLLHAIAYAESRHQADAVSPAGAVGVMQLMPATAQRFGGMDDGAGLEEPALNIDIAARYLQHLHTVYGRDSLPLVLAAYNAGEGAVARYGGRVPPYPQTRAYIHTVLMQYRHLSAVGRAHRWIPLQAMGADGRDEAAVVL